MEDADRAIHVLMAAGVSTYSLRQASLKGVDITSAGHAEIALPFGNLGPFLLVAIGDFLLAALFDPSQSVYLVVMAISILSRVALVIIVLRTEQLDERFEFGQSRRHTCAYPLPFFLGSIRETL